MAINTGSFSAALQVGVNKWYGDKFAEYKPQWPQIFSAETSRKNFEEDISISGLGLAVQKAEGGAVQYDTMQQGFKDRYTHAVYSLGFMITKELVDDDLYDVVGKKRAEALAFSMRQTKDINGANILNRFTNGSYVYGDGVALGSASHPNVAGGTWSNMPSVAVDLSEAALEQAVIDIGNYTNDRGMRIQVKAQKLIVPINLQFDAERIMKTEYELDSANHNVNVVRSRFPMGVDVNNYLTDVDAWFIKTDVSDGAKMFQRSPMVFKMEDDFDTDNAKFKASERYSFGVSDKRSIYGSAGA